MKLRKLYSNAFWNIRIRKTPKRKEKIINEIRNIGDAIRSLETIKNIYGNINVAVDEDGGKLVCELLYDSKTGKPYIDIYTEYF